MQQQQIKPVGQLKTPVSTMSSDVIDFLETLDTKDEEEDNAEEYQELNFNTEE